ncbi:putative sulphohydrolase/glycosulfatase [Chlamydia pneumoniae TW-183]|uniref:Ribonuclease Z n=2 Tax=Chlamydia pneumoniae TaxID=83558 RepID=RNZ_CHLPN|nr:ribonuclease Z [Chlamydia pneumoniae]Q9Z9F6.1 RecName: Full=Ribonuclease Z; Short=RNase Z; AltName: Full=tRNA 3 endonuclease; AltName: Full=tRNase Z [Chlamydia pneumoniae]AAD18178.1 Sulphohydrolase/Glycosulfatase [Chlamydia pneumoniae CWL029]AAF38556.1 AtsA/ElaC family protein [Chlamydia pneumoniae AR39]AAP97962.1 putative sulphohydrolase/glycosulfatase [Chlamydia pneumoniae TW-183]CRI32521.1 Ribonuclease Z [Chlamydia pneumoniae]CRI35381.1 Ribonuclease Z [Chlamydia pneumoniae]
MSSRELIILGCSSQQPTRTRNQGAYLFRWNGEGLLFDPGEGTQRQFIFANIAPTTVNRIFVSHFHGDHCLGLGSMLMRLNLDKVSHPIHCYYPASGKKYFDRLRYGTIYHETIQVVEHPISEEGIVEDFGSFRIEAQRLQHQVDTLGWRITEPDTIKFLPKELESRGIRGLIIQDLIRDQEISIGGSTVYLSDVSYVRKGDSIAIIADTLPCQAAIDLAKNSCMMLCESTYLEQHRHLAESHFHMTAKQAATLAKRAATQKLILTHFSARYLNLDDFYKEASAVFPNVSVAQEYRSYPFPKNPLLNK